MSFLTNLAITLIAVLVLASVWVAIPILASIGVVLLLGFIVYFITSSYRQFKKEEQQLKEDNQE